MREGRLIVEFYIWNYLILFFFRVGVLLFFIILVDSVSKGSWVIFEIFVFGINYN